MEIFVRLSFPAAAGHNFSRRIDTVSTRKLQLNQETLKNLTRQPEKQDMAYTYPPVCENTGNCRL
jgi:hypothetical protein